MIEVSTKKIAIFLSSVIFTTIGFYAVNFHDHDLSGNPEQWGQLGDYIGGVLNPVLSFTTIVILIITVGIQSKQLKSSQEELALTREELQRTAEATARQANHFEKEAKLKEYLVLIDKLATRVNRNFNENKLDGERSLHGFVSAYISESSDSYISRVVAYYERDGSNTQRVVQWVVNDLERLSQLIVCYERISNGDNEESGELSPIPRFYQMEFGDLAETLNSFEMMVDELKEFYRPS